MRFLVKVSMAVEAGNEAVRKGTIGATINRILSELKPEAAYFCDSDGKRTGFLIIRMEDAHEIPSIAEPWFLAFNAAIEIHPVMAPEDLEKAGPDFAKVVKAYG